MTYPQPNSNDPAINGGNFFRLNTPLVSAGDIYESEQGARAFALGPQSDISRVMINYFDENQGSNVPQTFLNALEISPQRAFVGNIAARNDVTYQPAGRPGRVLFWVSDLYNAGYRPEDANVLAGQVLRVPPQLDIIQYFQPMASLTGGRDDKTFYFQDVPQTPGVGPGKQPTYIVLPYYGRAYAFISLTNRSGAAVTLTVIGTNYAINNDSIFGAGTFLNQETTLLGPTVIADNAQKIKIVRAGVDGMFDALVIKLQGNPMAPTPLKIVMSDNPL